MFPFHIWFSLCLAAYLSHTAVHVYDLRGKAKKSVQQAGALVLLLSWISWIGMLSATQPAIPEVQAWNLMFFVGLFQTVAGASLIFLGLKEKPSFESRTEVLSKGIYSKFLHPVYYGMILLLLGLPLLASAQYSLYTAPLWIGFIVFFMVTETRYLEMKGGKRFHKIEEEVLI